MALGSDRLPVILTVLACLPFWEKMKDLRNPANRTPKSAVHTKDVKEVTPLIKNLSVDKLT